MSEAYYGEVTRVTDNMVTVSAYRDTGSCGSCFMSSVCRGDNRCVIDIDSSCCGTYTPVAGDYVEVTPVETSRYAAIFWCLAFPLVVMVGIALLLGLVFSLPDGVIAASALCAAAGYYVLLWRCRAHVDSGIGWTIRKCVDR